MGIVSLKPSAKKAETSCPVCGKTFLYYRSWPRKYCSNVCKGKAGVGNTGKPVDVRYVTDCEICGTSFSTIPSQAARFCSQACFGQWVSRSRVGRPHPQKGKPLGRRTEWPVKTCPTCAQTFEVKPSHVDKRVFCSKGCLAVAQAISWSGENNPGWTGGYEPYYGPSWRPAMRAVRERDKVCRHCGKSPEESGRALDVHHIVPFRSFGLARHKEANALTNLLTLCNRCHLNAEWVKNRREPTA